MPSAGAFSPRRPRIDAAGSAPICEGMTTTCCPTEDDLAAARDLRHQLHSAPELSSNEAETARIVAQKIREAGADVVMTDLGGHGVAAIFDGADRGPSIMIRAELDALPITEQTGVAHRSTVDGVGHLCGHDGHMAILYALARRLGRDRPARGRVILLFQPAEESGEGAAALLEDPQFRSLAPDRIVSLHNYPGFEIGHAILDEGPIATAATGMLVRLQGRAAHASQPEDGISPRLALVRLMQSLPALGSQAAFPDDEFALVTVARVLMGETAFGVAPGEGEIRATLRTMRDAKMDRLIDRARAEATAAAEEGGLGLEISYHEIFAACDNAPEAVADLRAALDDLGVPHTTEGQPWRPAEDFGRLGEIAPAAMLFLGSGLDQPPLHDPRYDFPDELIGHGARIFARVVDRALA